MQGATTTVPMPKERWKQVSKALQAANAALKPPGATASSCFEPLSTAVTPFMVEAQRGGGPNGRRPAPQELAALADSLALLQWVCAAGERQPGAPAADWLHLAALVTALQAAMCDALGWPRYSFRLCFSPPGGTGFRV
jgi:hypothetical protein